MTNSTEAVEAFVKHVWINDGIDLSQARTRFFNEHDLKHDEDSEQRLIPHYCTTCGVLDHLELPRT